MPSPWIWEPTREWVERTNVHRFMRRLGFDEREAFLRYSAEHLEEFWDELTREIRIEWDHPYSQVLDTSAGVEWATWFLGGRINIARNCLDRHAGAANPAILWEGEDGATRRVTFAELLAEANRLAHAMESLGIGEGDRVALCMPMVPEIVSILYACFKTGTTVVPIFSGFGEGAIATRLEDSGARLVFTADALLRRGRIIPLKEKVDRALEKAPAVEHVVVVRYRDVRIPWNEARDRDWSALLRDLCPDYTTPAFDSEMRAFLLYTSGTTGKPKGTVHTHAGSLVQMAKEIWLAFDHQPEDRFFWLSDIGWMMGPWMILGNHHFGGTIFLYDGAPDFPRADRLWDLLLRHRITTFGISPTAVRLLMATGAEFRPVDSIRLLGSTGEPWDESSYLWFFEHAAGKRAPIINISGGTEIVGCFLLPLPIQPLKPCTLGGPAPGMATDVVDSSGHSVRGQTGFLVCRKPAPSMTRGVWNDPKRYLASYWSRFPGMWFHGDWASVDQDGCWFLHGRADESMNVAGRKVGPAEVEQALMEHPLVAEAAVIGVPHPLKGEAIAAFLVLQGGSELTAAIHDEIAALVARSLGAAFRPDHLTAVSELPKTQSGKIVRRLIRQKYLGESPDDLSTVVNPGVLEQFGSNRVPIGKIARAKEMQLPARIGKYELLEFLGGGMSHVYRATDTLLDRTVALKILTEAGVRDAEAKARFLHEAKLAGNIGHDNIVNIFDYGVEGSQPYIVMEFVRGESLRDAIKNNHTGDMRNRLRIAHQIASALEYVHSKKIIHRDVKPDNIHIEPSGRVKLMDFGIAKSEGVAITKLGFTLGTPYYMAPEQILGQQVTTLVDIYAFGILLFELLCGRKPITPGSIEQIFHQILHQPLDLQPLREAGVPPNVEAIVVRATAKNAAERYQTFADLARDIEQVIGRREPAGVTGPHPLPQISATQSAPAVKTPQQPTPVPATPKPASQSPGPPPVAQPPARPITANPAPVAPTPQPALRRPTSATPVPAPIRTPAPQRTQAPAPSGMPGFLGNLPRPLQTPQGLMVLTALIVVILLAVVYGIGTLLVR